MAPELTTPTQQPEISKYLQSKNQRFKGCSKLDSFYFFIALESVGQVYVFMDQHISTSESHNTAA